jgi:iron complex transport system substrate-binding protein
MLRALLLLLSWAAVASGADSPTRIASYSPGATQTLLDLGVGERIVAATRWCPLPKTHPAARSCDAFNPDLETLLQTKPDLVILPRLANPLWAERCERAGLRVLVLRPESATSAQQDIASIAQATGRETAAKPFTEKTSTHKAGQPKTLLVIWDGMMAGPDAYTAWPLKQAGFVSPLPQGAWIKLDWETLLKAAPDAILWVESAPENQTIALSEKHLAELSEVVGVKELKSVKSKRVYTTQSGSDWLPGTGLTRVAEKLQTIRESLP